MKVYIDDLRNCSEIFIICRTFNEFKDVVKNQGFPEFISFDHDLGYGEPTGYDIAKWIVEEDMKRKILPINFSFNVHSANPVGKANIEGLLNGYLKFKGA